jgi:ABC-2 type transport system ATP-binding protein
LLELGAGFHPDLTGRENIYLNAALLGLSRKQTDNFLDAIIDFSGVEEFIDTQVKFFSSGMHVRLGFSVAIHVNPDLLLVDEVLAVGDEPFQRKCMDKISEFQSEGRTIVLVSHSAEQVGSVCDRVIVLDQGRAVFDGGTQDGLRVLRETYNARSRPSHIPGTREERPYTIAGVDAEATTSGNDVAVHIAVTVMADAPRKDWGVKVAILSSLGVRIHAVDSFSLGRELSSASGKHVVEFTFPNAALGSGTYVVNAAVQSSTGQTWDAIASATSFAVARPMSGSGLMQLEASVDEVDD